MTVSLHKFSPGFFPGKLNLRGLCSFGSCVTGEASIKASLIHAAQLTCLAASSLEPGEGKRGNDMFGISPFLVVAEL